MSTTASSTVGPMTGLPAKRGLLDALFSWRMLICILMGFSSGLPLWVIQNLIPAWLRTSGVDLKTIGLFAFVGVPWTWKFLWAPLLDRFVPPWLGRRRGWAIATQLALGVAVAAYGWLSPASSIASIAYLCIAVAFFSASQDIVLDAYRRELLQDEELGLGNALFVNAYRVAALVPGGLALVLADHYPWRVVFLVTAAFMAVGVLTTLLAPEPRVAEAPPRTLREAVVEPFAELFRRRGWRIALSLLAFMFLYKLGDSMATALATPFYLDVGFSLTTIGTTVKVVTLVASVGGALIGGVVMLKIGINRGLWLFGGVQIASILGFALLSQTGAVWGVLVVAVAFEYLGVGLGTTAFVAFMMRATSKRFSATQFALFSSFIALPRTFANASTGFIVEQIGWTWFFLLCTCLAIPGMAMLLFVAPWRERDADAGEGQRGGTQQS